MKKYLGSTSLDASFPKKTVVAIGNFDGVHLGHQAILAQAKVAADRLGAQVVAYTFRPHPTISLRPESPFKLLMTYDEKLELIDKQAVSFCVEEVFSAEFAKTSAQNFLVEILKKRLNAVAIVVGHDFSFGRGREGSIDTIKKFADQVGMEVIAARAVQVDGTTVSSSKIREALARGDVSVASKYLGRPFFYRGIVVHGDKRGRTIGFPTANMKSDEKFPLKSGVYATSVFWRSKEYASVSNLGTRPTFKSTGLKLETHILDHTFELYGESLEIRFHEFIREEKKFATIDELKVQISADTKLAKDLLSPRNF